MKTKAIGHRRIQARLLPLLLLGLALALPAASAWAEGMTSQEMVAAANKVITTVTIAQAKEELGKSGVVFLDVREKDEFAKGHIPGAVLIPRGLLEFSITTQVPDKATRLVVYCKVGGRGALAAETLGKMGYTNVVNIQGGWEPWLAAGYPAE